MNSAPEPRSSRRKEAPSENLIVRASSRRLLRPRALIRGILWKNLSVLLGLAFFAGVARAELINGRNYIGLAAWAKVNGFGGYSLNSGTEFILTNRTSRLVFNQDSADSTINGVRVRLSFPVAKAGSSRCWTWTRPSVRWFIRKKPLAPKRSRRYAWTLGMADETRVIYTSGVFSAAMKKLTRWRWRWNYGDSCNRRVST